MKTGWQLSFLLLILSVWGCSQEYEQVYMFSYFINGGKDGLHLAYSYDGYKWEPLNNNQSFLKPEVSKDSLMRDPCIIQGPDGKFHMVWTVSWNERGIGYANSDDLIHWSEQKYIPVMEHEPEARNCWAPELYYDDQEEKYMIYWATTIPGRFPETDSTGDKGYNHRMYFTTTKDFEVFSDTKLLFDPGFNVIDAVIKKIDGTYTMFVKDETRYPPKKNIRIAKSDKLTGGYEIVGEPITINWVEGPTVLQIGNEWNVYYDEYTRHKMGAVKTTDLVEWEDISDQLSFPEGCRHGTICKVDKKVLTKLLGIQ